MKRVFISGPYRAATEYGVLRNIEHARDVAVKLWQVGYAVFCPHMNSAGLGGSVPDDAFIEGCLAWVQAADLVVMLDGWERSDGAKAELALALTIGIPVYGEHRVPEVST